MTETSLDTTLSVEPACPHTELDVKQRVMPQGNGFLLHVDQVICKLCGEAFVSPNGKGSYSPSSRLVLLPASSITTASAAGGNPQPKKKSEPQSIREQLGDGAGTELVEMWHGRGVRGCELCVQLARKMNEEGTNWCRKNVDAIVEDCLPRVRDWFDNATYRDKFSAWWKGSNKLSEAMKIGSKAATWQLDDGLRAVIRSDVMEAIRRAAERVS